MKYRTLHKWNVSPREAKEIQNRLEKSLILKSFRGKIRSVAGVDVSFPGDKQAKCAIIVLSYPELETIEVVKTISKISFPYIPTLLTFREGPPILSAFKKLRYRPDVVLFDGQGIAHPRIMGEAAHLGILLNIPTIGCAKSRLYGSCREPGKVRGSRTCLKDSKRKTVGAALRTRAGIKPIFISCGHKMDLETAIEITLNSSPKFRIPEPLRMAHSIAKF